MEKIIVHGCQGLSGTIKASGAKNAVLPIICASILAEKGTSTIEEVPALDDVFTIKKVLENLNVDVAFKNNTLFVDASKDLFTKAPYEYCLLYTSPSPRDVEESRMPSSA